MMKSIFTIILSTFTLLLFSQGINKTDAKGKKQGEWKKLYENGFVRYQGQFKDDKPFGTFNYYFDTGKPSLIMNYDGVIARTLAFYDEGKIKAKGNYVNQKKDSIWIYYSLAGYKVSEELHVNGLKQGKVLSTLDPARKAINRYGVRTPKGVAAARGTVYAVRVDVMGSSIATMSAESSETTFSPRFEITSAGEPSPLITPSTT